MNGGAGPGGRLRPPVVVIVAAVAVLAVAGPLATALVPADRWTGGEPGVVLDSLSRVETAPAPAESTGDPSPTAGPSAVYAEPGSGGGLPGNVPVDVPEDTDPEPERSAATRGSGGDPPRTAPPSRR
ncbi:MAG: hypothetical protein GX427_12070 [Actinomycetales bacterium]|nr:hypothetical protein [Actinomycetales bacterium]